MGTGPVALGPLGLIGWPALGGDHDFLLPWSPLTAGLEQVLEFMYTAKLSLSPENVDEVLTVAGFLQMHEIISACNTLRSLSAPVESSRECQEALEMAGRGLPYPKGCI